MQKTAPAADPDAYARALKGWRRACVVSLREATIGAAPLDEVIKWGNLVYLSNGPVLVIRAEAERVLFGFWRGRHLLEIEPRLKPSGKYEMATVELREGDSIAPAKVRRLVREAVALNKRLGDPTDAAKPGAKRAAATRKPTKKPIKKNAKKKTKLKAAVAKPGAIKRRKA